MRECEGSEQNGQPYIVFQNVYKAFDELPVLTEIELAVGIAVVAALGAGGLCIRLL